MRRFEHAAVCVILGVLTLGQAGHKSVQMERVGQTPTVPVEGAGTSAVRDMVFVPAGKFQMGLNVGYGDQEPARLGYRSSGVRPVGLAIRASMRGPISVPSWKAHT